MTDPSMQGTPSGTLAERYSLAEIDATCRKATRGAGYPWGLAEEAGKAARWLAARGLPGPEALAGLLTENDGRAYADMQPVHTASGWQAASGRLCPIMAGAALEDRALDLVTDARVYASNLSWPLLLLPFLAQAARLANVGLATGWQDLEVLINPAGIGLNGPRERCLTAHTSRIDIQTADATPCPIPSSALGCPVPAPAWQILDRFSARTYVPASAASRLAGAGAGIHDSD